MLQIDRTTITAENTNIIRPAESKMGSDAKGNHSAGSTIVGHRTDQHAARRAVRQRGGGMWRGGRRVDPSWLKKLRLKLQYNGLPRNGHPAQPSYRCPTVAGETAMNALSNAGAVPDSAFPFANELEGLIDAPLSPEGCPMGGLKLAAAQGDGGYAPNSYPQFPFEQDYLCGALDVDWLCQDTLLLTPEGQDSDVASFLPPPAAIYASPNVFHSLPTPESSQPPSPTSCPDQDVLDALSIIDGSPDSRLNQSADVLPQFDKHSPLSSPASYNPSPVTYSPSPTTYEFPTSSYEPNPMGTFLPSPLPLPARDFSPETSYSYTVGVDSPLPCSPSQQSDSIRGLLVKTEDTPCTASGSSRKRKSESTSADASDGVSKGKRRKLSKVAKKERKKEQNKQAALRYRQRKKGEVEVIEDKKEELEAVNSGLKSQVHALMTEINYLKKLWKEIEAAKAKKPHLQTELQSSHLQ